MALEKFDILEEKVGQLAEKYAQLRSEKENFTNNLQQKDKEILDLQDKVRSLEEEKEMTKSRLDKIISSLENTPFNF